MPETGERHVHLGLVVVSYGSAALIESNFTESTSAEGLLSVAVVDNFSTQAERRACADLCRRRGWLLLGQPNLGYGAGANLGLKALDEAGCVAMIVANPDLRMSADAMARLGQLALAHPAGLIGPRILGPTGRTWGGLGVISLAEGRLYTRSDQGGVGPSWLSGACLAASAQFWRRSGGFDDRYFMYWEDVDLSFRAQQLGGACFLAEDVTVSHDVGGTQGGDKSSLYYYYNARNRLEFAAANLDRSLGTSWVRSSGGELRRILSRGRSRSSLARIARGLMPALAGTISGVWSVGKARRRQGRHD